jgi:hypothetical protein
MPTKVTADQGTGMYVTMRTQMPVPKKVTPKPDSIERTTKGSFIQNRPKEFEG